MPQKRHTVDQIVAKLRKADVERGKGRAKGKRAGYSFACPYKPWSIQVEKTQTYLFVQ